MTADQKEGQTIFHKIINKEIPSDIVYEDDLVVAFRDINPVSSTHILIVPRKSIPTLSDAIEDDEKTLGHALIVAAQIARHEGLSEKGYRVVINNGKDAQQTVFQIHLHLLGGRSFSWPPG